MSLALMLGNSLVSPNAAVIGTLPPLSRVALLGDSYFEIPSTGLTRLHNDGWPWWARAFGGSKWDPVRNGSTFDFATTGATTQDVIDDLLPACLLSAADVVFDGAGLNDCMTGVPVATIVANRVEIWSQINGENKTPVAFSIPPIPTTVSGNEAGEFSAVIAEANPLIEAAAAANGVLFCNITSVNETVAGNGIADPAYTKTADPVHGSPEGMSRMGRVAAAFLAQHFVFPYDPYAVVATPLNSNPTFAGSSGQPTGWGNPSVGSGSLNSKTLVARGDGLGNWWRLDTTYGGSSSFFIFDSATLGSQAGKVLETLIECQVLSGSFTFTLDQSVAGGTGTTTDLYIPGATSQNEIKPEDGVIVLRAPYATIGVGATDVSHAGAFRGTGVIQFGRPTIREITPP